MCLSVVWCFGRFWQLLNVQCETRLISQWHFGYLIRTHQPFLLVPKFSVHLVGIQCINIHPIVKNIQSIPSLCTVLQVTVHKDDTAQVFNVRYYSCRFHILPFQCLCRNSTTIIDGTDRNYIFMPNTSLSSAFFVKATTISPLNSFFTSTFYGASLCVHCPSLQSINFSWHWLSTKSGLVCELSRYTVYFLYRGGSGSSTTVHVVDSCMNLSQYCVVAPMYII